ncbi:MAG TPA: hypothetical protein VJZ98_03830 [Actinomycetota bacterium]|nr:hypothetical protein [Actinomycetota bacterium]
MSTDRYRAPTEPDQDAYEDAWYRALKAKASRRSADPKDDTTDDPQAPVSSSPPAQNEGDAGAR